MTAQGYGAANVTEQSPPERPSASRDSAASETTGEAWTIAKVLAWATKDFKERAFESPRLEAEVLLANVLGVDRIRLIVEAERPLETTELSRFRDAIKRRRTGEPVAYVIGEREFYGLAFRVDARVLIPRPDTEILVETALTATRSRNLGGRALDLCTGSGCVAIAFAKHRPTWQVTGTDLSVEALEVARQNALRLGTVWGVRFAQGDLFDAVAKNETFDLITANPPYIPAGDIAGLQKDIRDFEPRLALDGGADGLTLLPKIAQGAFERLTPGGMLAVEIGAGQAGDVAKLFEKTGLVDVQRHKDYGGHERVVSARKA
jgi:release factor glutamine methyltransferase